MEIALIVVKLAVALAPVIILQMWDYRRFRQEIEADPQPDWLKGSSWVVSRSRRPRNPPPPVLIGLLA